MKTIYLQDEQYNWQSFTYDGDLADALKSELESRKIAIGDGAKIGNDATIGDGAGAGEMITRLFIESLGWVRKPNGDDVFTHPYHEGAILSQGNDLRWHLTAKGDQSLSRFSIPNPTEDQFMEWSTIWISEFKGANKWPWWMEAIAKWQAVRARGESLRSEHDKQSKIEAEARRVAAGIDGDYTYLLELCGNWPGQEMAFLDAVENTANYGVRPWDDRNRPSCSCHISPPCDTCVGGNYYQDWSIKK